MLVRIFYVSEIAGPISQTDVQVILGQAQIRNRRLDVTGMLAKSDGHFCQVLEGRQESVNQVMELVRRSPKHRAVRVLLEEPITQREFNGWSMGLIVRDDMADEMQSLHSQGRVEGVALDEVIKKLMFGTNFS